MCMRHVVNCSAVLWLVTLSGIAFGETLTDYFPLEDGNSWTYRDTGPGYTLNMTETVLGTVVFNGRSTKAVQSSGGPDGVEYEYVTNDIHGVRFHGFLFPTEGRVLLEPPAIIAGRTMDVNETVESNGRATFIFFETGTALLDYEVSSTFQGYETVTVPAGMYETIRLRSSLRVYGKIGDERFDDTQTSIDWFAKNIGIIQSQSEGEQEQRVLLRTNVRQAGSLTPILDLLLD